MTAATTRKSRKPFDHQPIEQQVQQMMPVAQSIVLNGFENMLGDSQADDGISQRVTPVLGYKPEDCTDRDDDRAGEQLTESLYAAFALGLSVGLLMRPEAFGIRGGR